MQQCTADMRAQFACPSPGQCLRHHLCSMSAMTLSEGYITPMTMMRVAKFPHRTIITTLKCLLPNSAELLNCTAYAKQHGSQKTLLVSTVLHADATPGEAWTPSGCCSQPRCDHLQAAFQQRSDAAGQGECLQTGITNSNSRDDQIIT